MRSAHISLPRLQQSRSKRVEAAPSGSAKGGRSRSSDTHTTSLKSPDAGPPHSLFSDNSFALVVGLSATIVYWATAARDIVVGDTGDFLTTAATLGVAHPPGYPLLVLLGHLFSLAPVGPLPFRMNLVASVSHAITVAMIFSIALRIGTSRWAASIEIGRA